MLYKRISNNITESCIYIHYTVSQNQVKILRSRVKVKGLQIWKNMSKQPKKPNKKYIMLFHSKLQSYLVEFYNMSCQVMLNLRG